MIRIMLSLMLLITAVESLYPCSAIVLKEGHQIFLAKNFDWTFRQGMLIKNLRGTSKRAYFTHAGEQAFWTSKYGSITFNQNGKEMPYGGMNEKGLVVEMLWLDITRYNISDEKPYLNELEWIQYQLDQFESVRQVLDHLNDLKIYPIKGKIHYILTDATGESVIIEYVSGTPLTYKKEANICQAITNHSVTYSAYFKNQIKGIRKNNTAPSYRYYQLEQEIAGLTSPYDISEAMAFAILNKVTIPKGDFKTMWSIVYNVQQKSISFFTDTHKEIKTVHLTEMDFDEDLSWFDLNQDQNTNPGKSFRDMTEADNFSILSPSLIQLGFDATLTRDVSSHHFAQSMNTSSVFADHYFHFEISIPMEEEKQTGFLAIMDSEENFNKRQAVTGGYITGTIGKGMFIVHIYGLKNGRYSMLAFIDDNKNKKLDFDKSSKPMEPYATFGDHGFSAGEELNFSNTSAYFDSSNASITIELKR